MNRKGKAKAAAIAVFLIGFMLAFALAGGVFSGSAFAATLVSSGNTVPHTPTTLHYEVVSHNTNYKVSQAHATKYAELFRTGSAMLGKQVNEFSILVSKVGNPTGFMTAGALAGPNQMATEGNFIYFMGGADVATRVTSSPTWLTFRNDTAFNVVAGTRFGINYNGGDANNYLVIYAANTNPFNGDLAYKQRWDGTQWWATASEDLTAVIGYTPTAGTPSDTTKPVITITAPTEGATVRNPVTVSGTATDAGGIKTLEVRSVYYDPVTQKNTWQPWKVVTMSGNSFSTTLTADKMTFIGVRATDNSGNIAWKNVNVNFIPDVIIPPQDTTAPVVTITAPAGGVTIASASVEVMGTATDNVAVVNTAWKLDDGNFTPVALTGSDFGFSMADVPIGSHTLKVQATDAAGNIGTASVAFTTISDIPQCQDGYHLENGVCVIDDIPEEGSADGLILLGGLGASGLASIGTYRRMT